MPYTAAQLSAYYTALTGTAPVGADAVLINAYATQSQNGTLSDVNALLGVFNSAGVQATFEVAESTYQFFTGSGVTLAGLNFLEGNAGGGNANGLNSAFYANFNTENRYYNFAINLASAGGAGNANFVATYGTLTFAQTVATAYETIVGSSNVGTAAANAAIADITSRQAFFTSVAQQRAGGVDAGGAAGQNIALKAIVVGYILEEANKADVGTYAKALDQLEAAVAASATVGGVNNPYGLNFLTTFGSSGTGFNSGFAALGANANGQTAFPLTTGIDTPNLTTGNINYVGTVNVNGANSNVVNPSTLQAGDQIKGTGANNTLTVTTIGTNGGAALDASGQAVITGIQTINVRAVPDTTGGTAGGATFNAQASGSGSTALNSYLTVAPVTFTNVSNQSVGMINDGVTTGGSLTANYVSSATTTTINLAGGTTTGETVTVTGTGLVTANVNSNGGINRLTTLALPTTVTTLNLASTSPLTVTTTTATGLTKLTATGSGSVNLGTAADIGGGAAGTGTITTVDTTGLTSTGALTARFFSNATTAATYSLGAGSDVLILDGNVATGTVINLGGGTNSITVNGNLLGTASIVGGSAADVVTVTGTLSSTSSINTGGGGDTVNFGTAIGGAATFTAGASINGGGNATLVTDQANLLAIDAGTAAQRALVTGFSNIAVDDALQTATYDINAVGGTNFATVGAAAGQTATVAVNTGAIVTFSGNIGGFGGGDLSTNTGAVVINEASVFAGAAANTITLGYQAQPAAVTSNVTLAASGTTGVQTVNVVGNAAATNGTAVTLNLTDTAATTINFAGNDAYVFNPTSTATTGFSVLKTINGSTGTGTETIDVSALQSTLNSPVSVTTGFGNDVVTVRDFARVATGVATSSSTFNTIQVDVTSSGQTYSSVVDAKATDHIVFGNEAVGTAGAFATTTASINLTKIVLAATAVFQDYLDAATGGANDVAGRVSAFDFGGNTYLVENNSVGTQTYQNGADSVIQLVGIHTVASTSTAATGIILAS